MARPRPLTFRDHILRSVPYDTYREVPVGTNGMESVLVLARADIGRMIVCECHDGYADCTVLGQDVSPRSPEHKEQSAVECNTTDHVTALWSRA